ncbi:cell envelope integrity protein TolA [Vibrio bivalvicida]|uniref:Protein TolA n=1 Tax=Vibrio bivalvicida TaxID=1276888 RepID=A0A177Y5V2_9VIBR|nr:cell envelope integrity protein TolA [Vibrio bivalvicida]OAJ95905.1 protein TolA [Vibrio bivalvicida]
MKENKSKKNDFKKPIIISAALHALLIAALIWGTDFTMSKPEPTGRLVQAVVIDPDLVRQQAQQIRSKREEAAKKEQERLDKLRRESEQLEKNRKAEEERIRKLKEQQVKEAKATREAEKRRVAKEKERKAEEARAKKEKERAAKLEVERKAKEQAIAKAEQERIAREKAAKEAEEKARREREAAAKAEKDRIAKEKAAKEAAEKARKEKERLKRIERERKEQEAALNDIFSGLETEAEANSSARSRHLMDERSRYIAIYQTTVESNLLKDQSYAGRSCLLNIKLVPAGSNKAFVSSATVIEGDSSLCRAAKASIAKAREFDFPQEPELQKEFRDFDFRFNL